MRTVITPKRVGKEEILSSVKRRADEVDDVDDTDVDEPDEPKFDAVDSEDADENVGSGSGSFIDGDDIGGLAVCCCPCGNPLVLVWMRSTWMCPDSPLQV